MDEREFYVDSRFSRIFSITSAWLLIVPGLFFLFVTTAKLVGILFTFSGLGILGMGTIGRKLKTGYYSRNRIILLALSGFGMLVVALSTKVFFVFSNQEYWLVYFAITIGLLLISAIALIKSIQRNPKLDESRTGE